MTGFERVAREQQDSGVGPWGEFEDEDEWELAQFLIKTVGQVQTDKFLKLPIISEQAQPSYKNVNSFLQKIDAIPTQPTPWIHQVVSVAGDQLDDNDELMVEELELWRRDPVECVRELIGNPMFRDHLSYMPELAYRDQEGKVRIFDEMWTGDWWWKIQASLGCFCCNIGLFHS
ncbi:hypothetical protein JAAARDRAFT_126057 [Jaapia argillacea MUCL 33604]|uniref:Uncharacterized protein n=1 Tax=Jaapia argillacea MUCL 33604 TaxID=933084 RepID=A0A067Q1Q8_9AGAM|nr:hypothetical protein JAAARDRAFT_126057 [Jaapia argillacea MUCL 33604]